MSHSIVVVNDCAAVAVPGGPISIRTRDTAHGGQNFTLNPAHVAEGLPRQLTSRELDWIETIGHLFAIDLACPRGRGDLEWARSIDASLPVREPDFWNSIAPRIQYIFGEFTYDRLQLAFVADPNADSAPRQRRSPFPSHDCVSLLSGGVDSFVGTTALVDGGRRPLMVSHTAAGSISHAQGVVEGVLQARVPDLERVGLTARKKGSAFPDPEPSQRSRSFLFLAAACLAAAVGEVEEVYINENGVMAIHVPMTVARAGSLSTHTASPVVLEQVERLATDVLGRPISIRNVLLPMTKPEVVDMGISLGVGGPLADTVSCWAIGRTNQHCGVCAPCLMRRISFDLHGLADAPYKVDAFTDPTVLTADFACDNLTHLVRLTGDLQAQSDLELQMSYPELLNGGTHLPLVETLDLHRRWADQAATVLFAHPVPSGLR